MWDLEACLGKFLRITPTEIEFESFDNVSQHLRSTEYSTFLIASIRPSEIECEDDFSGLSQ